jgi:hypothetical protein
MPGLFRWGEASGLEMTGPAAERLKPPQQLRKASQTARGFTCMDPSAEAHTLRRHEPSAKADIAGSQPRIHSPGCGGSEHRPASASRGALSG